MECFKRFRHIDSHFASKQILKGFERSNHRRVNPNPRNLPESAKIQHHGSNTNTQLLDLAGIETPGPMKSIPVSALQYRVHQNTTNSNVGVLMVCGG